MTSSSTTSFHRLINAFRGAGLNVKHKGHDKAVCQAPGHSDEDLSVLVSYQGDQALIHSYSGEDTGAILDAIGLSFRDLFDNSAGVTYRYSDGRNVHRSPDRQFRQTGDTSGTALYGVEHLTTDMSAPVFVVEGEKDVNTARYNDIEAVSPPQGANTGAARFDWSPLAGRPVVIVADKDDVGRKHANDVADLVEPLASSVVIVEAAVGKDLTDHFAAGLTADDLVAVTPDIDATHEVFRRWMGGLLRPRRPRHRPVGRGIRASRRRSCVAAGGVGAGERQD